MASNQKDSAPSKALAAVIMSAFTMASIVIFSVGQAQAQSNIPVPAKIQQAKEVVFCSDITYPPYEFFPEGSKDPQGFDVDLGNEIGKRLGVKTSWENSSTDGLIAALMGNKCDGIISDLSVTPEREKQVDFINYVEDQHVLVVPKGNPRNVKRFEDACGLTVGAQIGSANYDDVVKMGDMCRAKGKTEPVIRSFKDDGGLRLALLSNQIDTYNQDGSNAAWLVKQYPDQFEIGALSGDTNLAGIAIRKDDSALREALTALIKDMYRDGTMTRLLESWRLTPFALKNP